MRRRILPSSPFSSPLASGSKGRLVLLLNWYPHFLDQSYAPGIYVLYSALEILLLLGLLLLDYVCIPVCIIYAIVFSVALVLAILQIFIQKSHQHRPYSSALLVPRSINSVASNYMLICYLAAEMRHNLFPKSY